MSKIHRHEVRIMLVVILLILFAIFLRLSFHWTGFGPLELAAGIARSLIYMGLFTAWGVSLHRRIIQAQERQYLVAVAAWALCSAVFALGIVLHKSRIPHSKRRMWLPLIPFALIALYTVGYVLRWQWQDFLVGDMTVTLCVLIAAIFESCLQCGLIASNTRYRELFQVSSVAAQIVDEAYHTALSSDTAMQLPTDVMARTAAAPVMLPEHIRLSGAAITGGYVLWTEDVSELVGVISDLEDLDEDLAGKHTVLHEEYLTRQKRQSLVEKNRLYNKMQLQTKEKIERLSQLTQRLSQTQDVQEVHLLTVEIAVLSAYLKRRNNLIFIAEESGSISASELAYCLRESVSNLRLGGADCSMQVSLTQTLPFEQVTTLYDAFEAAAEACLPSLKELFIVASMEQGMPVLCLNILCGGDLSHLSCYGFDVVREDEWEWTLTIGGDKG